MNLNHRVITLVEILCNPYVLIIEQQLVLWVVQMSQICMNTL